MAQKDYIQQGNPKAKKAAKKAPAGKRAAAGKKAPAGKKNAAHPVALTNAFPVIPAVVVGLILVGFGYFLWSINGAADDPSLVQNNPPVSVKPAVKKPPKPAKSQTEIPPPPEKEDWQYIDELKNKTVDVAVTKVEKKGPFLMQCATFKDARRAEAFKAQLALLNFESRIKVSKGTNGSFHRVQLGPYETNRDAQRARHKLSKHKINGCKIWLWS